MDGGHRPRTGILVVGDDERRGLAAERDRLRRQLREMDRRYGGAVPPARAADVRGTLATYERMLGARH